jgi:HK97 family phage portal protein
VLTEIPGLIQPTLAGVSVTTESAMRLIDVMASVRLLAETASTLPLKSYRRQDDGARVPFDGKIARLLERPSPATTTSNLIAQIVGSLALTGNAFIGKFTNREREITQLALLPVSTVQVKLERGQPVYRVSSSEGRQTLHGPDDVLHIKTLSSDGVLGLSPVAQAREALGQAQAIQEYGSALWANSCVLNGILCVEDPDAAISEDTKTNLVADVEGRHKGPSKAGKVAVFDTSVKWVPTQLSPVDAQWIEAQRLSTAQVARLFGVPPHLIGAPAETSSLHYSTAEQDSANFVRYSLQRFLTVVEEAISADRTLCPPSVFCEFDLRGFLRAHAKERAEVYERGIADGWLLVDEVRRAENLPPLGEPASSHRELARAA